MAEQLDLKETIKKMVYVLNIKDNKIGTEIANWKEKGYEVHFSGKKSLFGKHIEHMYIYSHGGMNLDTVKNGKAALVNDGSTRCTGKKLAEILRDDGYLRITEKKNGPLPIDEDKGTLITLMAGGAGVSQGNWQVRLFAKVCNEVERKKEESKGTNEGVLWEREYRQKCLKNNICLEEQKNNSSLEDYRNRYKDGNFLLPDNDTKPFVNDFWDEMTKLGMGYGQKIKRVHAFKTIVQVEPGSEKYVGDSIFVLMNWGVERVSEWSSGLHLLNSETITIEQAYSEDLKLVAIVPKPRPSEVDIEIRKVFETEDFSAENIETLLFSMEEKWKEDYLEELIHLVKIGKIQPKKLQHDYEKMLKMLKRETIEKMIYVLNEDKHQVDKEVKGWKKLCKQWVAKGYQVHFSGEKTLAGKLIKHMYIYSHGGLSKGPVRKKAALVNEGTKRCTAKELAKILQNDGYLKDNIKDKDLFFINTIHENQRPLITFMACGAACSQGNKQVELYVKLYVIADKKNDDIAKQIFWRNNYRPEYKAGPLPVTLEVKPFVSDFWEEMKNLGLGYENKIKRIHAFKAIVIPNDAPGVESIFGLMTYGLAEHGEQIETIDLDLNSETITEQQIQESNMGKYVTIIEPELPSYAVQQSLRLTNYPTSYPSQDQRMRNQNKNRRRQKCFTSNTIRGLRMIDEIQNKIQSEQLNSNNAHNINEEFWT